MRIAHNDNARYLPECTSLAMMPVLYVVACFLADVQIRQIADCCFLSATGPFRGHHSQRT